MKPRETLNDVLSSILSGAPQPNTRSGTASPGNVERERNRQIEFSVIFFSDVDQALASKYQLVFDVSAFADKNGFAAVWLPERHFHPFGGIYPNPAILASALAVRTEKLRIRSGSVVLPLHHPVEVVEAWSMVGSSCSGVGMYACVWARGDAWAPRAGTGGASGASCAQIMPTVLNNAKTIDATRPELMGVLHPM